MDPIPSQKDVMAAVNKRAKKQKNPLHSYYLWGGGFGAVFVLLLVMVLWEPKEDVPETRPVAEIMVNDDILIDKVNRVATTWQAGEVEFFNNYTLKSARTFGAQEIDTDVSMRWCPIGKVALLRSFDVRSKWPECFKDAPITSQGNCSSSYAVAAASSMANRFCISDPDTHKSLRLSAQQIVSCDDTNRGCKGGMMHSAFHYMEKTGLVPESCMPYKGEGVDCLKKCEDKEAIKSQGTCMVNSMGNMMAEIQMNGPIVAMVQLNKDFLVYKGGVYKPQSETSSPMRGKGRRRLLHAVKVIGWGVADDDDKTPFWTIENSWGTGWGEKGYGRIYRAHDDSGVLVESYVLASRTEPLPELKKAAAKDELDDLDEDDDDDDKEEKKDDLDDMDDDEVEVTGADTAA